MKRLMHLMKIGDQKNYYIIPLIAALLLLALACIGVVSLWYQAKRGINVLITQEIQNLSEIFKKIDQQCGIIGFDHQHTYIDFLNVNSFEGSEVGATDLAYPEKWKGAYLRDNPTIQGKVYEIVRTKKGYFIVPGTGVMLNDGRVIGKDIIFDRNADIAKMTEERGVLNFNGKPLAARLEITYKKSVLSAEETPIDVDE